MDKKINFEASILRLKEIVEKLEAGNISLDDSLQLFEEGAAISSECYGILKTAEQKITDITEQSKKTFEE